ncbi:VENN motif pre-toxin domain-containing protein [Kosakonia sacchari]
MVNAVLAAASGKNAATAAAGAATGELAGIIALDAWGIKDVSKLSEEQKQTVSALATLASGLAGALVGDSGANAIAGAQAGKTTVENNTEGYDDEQRPAPYGVLPGDVVMAKAREDAAKKINKKIKTWIDWLDNATECTFGRVCYSEYDKKQQLIDTAGDQIYNPDLTGGKLVNPDRSGEQGATNTGNPDGNPYTGGNTTATPIPDGPSIDDLAYLALKGKETEEAAKNLGFGRRVPPQKVPFDSHGQPAYFDGKTYITPDIDSHNVTNGWKMFDRKGNRMGTYDENLNRIKN